MSRTPEQILRDIYALNRRERAVVRQIEDRMKAREEIVAEREKMTAEYVQAMRAREQTQAMNPSGVTH